MIRIDFLVQYGPVACVVIVVVCAIGGYVRDRRRSLR